MPRVTERIAACVLALVASGCGAGTGARPVSGAKLFSEECSVGHSVIGNESLHRQGGDLLGYRLTHQQLVLQVRQMPVKRPLSQTQLDAVVQYVWSLQHSPARPQINLPAPAPRR